MSNQKIVTEAALSAIASDIKNALSRKANSNDVYPKSQTYNRTEIDNALNLKADKSEFYNFYPTEQESGAIAHFTDGADNIPVTSLVSQIVAIQSGSGTPSPSNPRAISGFDNGIITRCGVNLFDENRLLNASGWSKSGDYYVGNVGQLYSPFKLNGDFWHSESGVDSLRVSYTAYVDQANVNARVEFYYSDGTSNLACVINGSTPTKYTGVSTSGKTVIAVKWSFSNDALLHIKDFSINYPSNDTQYHAYNGNTYTFAFGQTVYGGHFDNKGNLVVTHGYIASYNGETINEPWVSSMDNYVPNTSPSTGAQVVYPLTSPITLSITSQDIPTLLGENNIFSNCGDVEVDYHADIGLYIDKKVSSLAQG
jgi:hypothetical protein